MKRAILACLLVAGAIGFVGCIHRYKTASGASYHETHQQIPPLEPDQGRVFIYSVPPRLILGTTAPPEPAVKLNNEMIGRAQPRGFFYVDNPPGNYVISTATEVKRTASFTLERGQTRYVRLQCSSGFWDLHVYPELVESEVAQEEIKSCAYTGAALKP